MIGRSVYRVIFTLSRIIKVVYTQRRLVHTEWYHFCELSARDMCLFVSNAGNRDFDN